MARTYKSLTATSGRTCRFPAAERGAASNRHAGPFFDRWAAPKLDPREALALGMIVHELATNALKYGALSNDSGRVEVTWARSDAPDDRWKSAGPSAVAPPSPHRSGMVLVRCLWTPALLRLNGHSSVTSAAKGLQAVMQLPRLHSSPRSEVLQA